MDESCRLQRGSEGLRVSHTSAALRASVAGQQVTKIMKIKTQKMLVAWAHTASRTGSPAHLQTAMTHLEGQLLARGPNAGGVHPQKRNMVTASSCPQPRGPRARDNDGGECGPQEGTLGLTSPSAAGPLPLPVDHHSSAKLPLAQHGDHRRPLLCVRPAPAGRDSVSAPLSVRLSTVVDLPPSSFPVTSSRAL